LEEEIIINISRLFKSVNGIPAITDLDLTIYSGEIYGIIGSTGAGKSMLIRLLSSLVEPDQGTIEIFGKPLISQSATILKEMGVLIGEPAFYEHLSVFENLSLAAKYAGIKLLGAEIRQHIKRIGLHDVEDTKVRLLPYGVKKKLSIAQALINQPKLVLLDEPFKGLDPRSVEFLKVYFHDIHQERQTTFIITSKLLDELEDFVSKIILLEEGRLISEGDLKELITKSKINLVLKVKHPEKALQLLKDSELPLDEVLLNEEAIRISCYHDTIPLINKFLFLSEVEVYTLQPENALKSYYLNFTK